MGNWKIGEGSGLSTHQCDAHADSTDSWLAAISPKSYHHAKPLRTLASNKSWWIVAAKAWWWDTLILYDDFTSETCGFFGAFFRIPLLWDWRKSPPISSRPLRPQQNDSKDRTPAPQKVPSVKISDIQECERKHSDSTIRDRRPAVKIASHRWIKTQIKIWRKHAVSLANLFSTQGR